MRNITSVTDINRRSFLAGGMSAMIAIGPLFLSGGVTINEPAAATTVRTIVLSETDVLNLKKIASTEVVASLKSAAFTNQTHGVVDTVLNRLASGKWGDTVAKVGNARWQFSGINSTLRTAYGSLEKMPVSHIKAKVAREVDIWLAKRAAGAESSVGTHLNYLNPEYSSAKSLKGWGWAVVRQAKKDGLVFGAGRAKHYHGTSVDNEKCRPGKFVITLEGK